MNELLTLVHRDLASDGYTVLTEIKRDVFCKLASIGQTEFYLAQATDLRPELKFVLPDYLAYEDEYLCIFNNDWYRVIRTYRKGQELEIVVQRASKEEVDPNGQALDNP